MGWKDKMTKADKEKEAIIDRKEEKLDDETNLIADSIIKDEEVRLFLAVKRGEAKYNILQKLNNP